MTIVHHRYLVRLLSAALVAGLGATLAACSGSSAPSGIPNDTSTSNARPGDSPSDAADSDTPKVPFGHQPCQSLTPAEQKNLGFAKPVPGKAARHPDDLAYDNACEYAMLGVEYDTRKQYEDQRRMLGKASHAAPGSLPGSFYDVLGNLWFAKNGYYVAVTNVGETASIEKVAATIAAKL